MSYNVYTTEAMVVGERASGEQAKVLMLFTRELGLVQCYAAGLRALKSKLRYHLQEYSFAYCSLIAGKEYWKLVGVLSVQPRIENGLSIRTAARIAEMCQRLTGLDDPHPDLFDEFKKAMLASINLVPQHEADFSTLLTARALCHLGYLTHNEMTYFYLGHEWASSNFFPLPPSVREYLESHIHKGLQASHLG